MLERVLVTATVSVVATATMSRPLKIPERRAFLDDAAGRAAASARARAADTERRRRDRTCDTDEAAIAEAGQAAADRARPKPKTQANFTDPQSRI